MKKLILILSTAAFMFSCDPGQTLVQFKEENISKIKEDTQLNDSIKLTYLDRLTECENRNCVEEAYNDYANQSTKSFATEMMAKEAKLSAWQTLLRLMK